MHDKQMTIEIPNITEEDHVRFNANVQGFYICQYDRNEVLTFLRNLSKFSTYDKLGFLLDLKNLKELTVSILDFFKDETSIGIWDLIYSFFDPVYLGYLRNEPSNLLSFAQAESMIRHNYKQHKQDFLSNDIHVQIMKYHL